MDIKTLLLYAALGCGSIGAGVAVWPHLTSDVAQLQESDVTGNVQHKGPPPIRTVPQEF